MGSLTRRSSQKPRRDRNGGGYNTTAPLISGPILVNTQDMSERMERLGCVQLNTGNEVAHNNNNNSSKLLLRSASAHESCDSCSVDTAFTEYLLPSDYILGTFPKELLENDVPSRQSSISNCAHSKRSSDSNCSSAVNRLSFYDNLMEDEDTPPPTPLPTPTTQARKELDAVLHDFLIKFTKFDLDEANADLFKPDEPVDSAIVSPMSEGSSAVVSPLSEESSSLPSDAADSPEQQRRGSRDEVVSSSEELSASIDNIIDEETGDMRQMQETIWRERRDSGVGSSLTREPT